MSAVGPLLRAELLRIRTSRMTWILLGAMALATVGVVALTLSALDAGELAGARGVRKVLTIGAGVSCFFTLSLGVIGMAGEYRHGTIGHPLLAAPARWPVVVAKASAYAMAGLAFGLVALALTFAIGAPGLAAEHAGIAYSSGLVRYAVVGTLAAAALFGVLGVGLGAVVHDQSLALALGLGWMVLVDGIVSELAPSVGKFLPGGAVTSLLRSQTQDVLPVGLAALMLLTYTLGLVLAGVLVMRRRDLT
jgi:hypothetical protein